MTATASKPASSGSTSRRWPSILLGLLLLLPGAICCGSTLLAPSVQTLLLSQQKNSLVGQAQWVGGANFALLAQQPKTGAVVGFTLEIVLVRLLAVVIVPVLLALAAGSLGRWVGGGLRLLFTLPLVLFAPTALVVAWVMERTPGSNTLSSPAGAQGTLLFMDGVQTLALACGVGLITYLAAARAGSGRAARGPLLLVWFISALAAVAGGWQTFDLPYLLTRGGPAASTTPLMLLLYQFAFQTFQFGPAAAVATWLLALLFVLGLLGGLAVVLGNARLDHLPAGASSALMPAVLAVLLVVVLGLAALGLWVASQLRLLQTLGPALKGGAGPAIQTGFGNSLLGPLAVLLIQLPLAYLTALGIGALRPLGRWSDWLLLPFSPWLFVTIGPLSLAHYVNAHAAGSLNTAVGLASPLFLSVPILFVLALFFKGRAGRWQAARAAGRSALGAFLGEVMLPSLPLALLLAVLGMLASYQELLWPLLSATRPGLLTGNVVLGQLLNQQVLINGALARALWSVVLPGFVLGLLALGLLQVLYLGRLVLRTGSDTN